MTSSISCLILRSPNVSETRRTWCWKNRFDSNAGPKCDTSCSKIVIGTFKMGVIATHITRCYCQAGRV